MKYTQAAVIDAIEKSSGMITPAARLLGCSQQTIRKYSKKYPAIAEAIESERNAFVDTAEIALKRAVVNGELTAIIFTLKTLGAKRGYIERRHVQADVQVTERPLRDLSVEELQAMAYGDEEE